MVAKEELVQTLTNYLLFRDIRHYFHDIISEKCNRVKSFEFLRESHGSINNCRAWRKLHVKFPENRVRPDPLEIPFKVAQTFNVRNELKDAKKKACYRKATRLFLTEVSQFDFSQYCDVKISLRCFFF